MSRLSLDDFAVIVSHKVRLRKVGNHFVGSCPFHNERTPSFNIYWSQRQQKPRGHCHGCGWDGDEFDWMRDVEGKSFRDAGGMRPDQEAMARISLEREQRQLLEAEITGVFDRGPDLPPEAGLFIEPSLAERVRRRLHERKSI
jgi:DNA primase